MSKTDRTANEGVEAPPERIFENKDSFIQELTRAAAQESNDAQTTQMLTSASAAVLGSAATLGMLELLNDSVEGAAEALGLSKDLFKWGGALLGGVLGYAVGGVLNGIAAGMALWGDEEQVKKQAIDDTILHASTEYERFATLHRQHDISQDDFEQEVSALYQHTLQLLRKTQQQKTETE